MISVVVPVLNDAAALERLLDNLDAAAAEAGCSLEVVVVDGGSRDAPQAVCGGRASCVMLGLASRGAQLACGVAASREDWIWLLHADSGIDASSLRYLLDLEEPGWGRFDVVLAGRSPSPLLRLVASLMNLRSRWTGICTGDQGMFVHRSLLAQAGGVPEQPLMEDIELSRRLKRIRAPLIPPISVASSARRWEKEGPLRTIALMWWLRLRYWLGVAPERLAQEYYRGS